MIIFFLRMARKIYILRNCTSPMSQNRYFAKFGLCWCVCPGRVRGRGSSGPWSRPGGGPLSPPVSGPGSLRPPAPGPWVGGSLVGGVRGTAVGPGGLRGFFVWQSFPLPSHWERRCLSAPGGAAAPLTPRASRRRSCSIIPHSVKGASVAPWAMAPQGATLDPVGVRPRAPGGLAG